MSFGKQLNRRKFKWISGNSVTQLKKIIVSFYFLTISNLSPRAFCRYVGAMFVITILMLASKL